MKTLLRKRYYCDHCNKQGGHAGHMRTHEKHCTANPQRECRVCPHLGNSSKPDIAALVAVVRQGADIGKSDAPFYQLDSDNMKALREAAGDCPVCIVAAFRQGPGGDEPGAFNLKEEMADIWKMVNDERIAAIGYVG